MTEERGAASIDDVVAGASQVPARTRLTAGELTNRAIRSATRWSLIRWLSLIAPGVAAGCTDNCGMGYEWFDGGPDAVPLPERLDCADEGTWSQAPFLQLPLAAWADVATCDPPERAYLALPLVGQPTGSCLRVRSSTVEGLDPGTYSFGPEGLVVGLTAPGEVDLEVRYLVYSNDRDQWQIVSERGGADGLPITMDAPRPIHLDHPPRALLDGAYADDEYILTTRGPAAWAPHFGAPVIGDLGTRYALVARSAPDEPATLRLISREADAGRLRGLRDIELTAPIDAASARIVGPGLVSGERFIPVDYAGGNRLAESAVPRDLEELVSMDLDEVVPVAYGRAGTALWVFDLAGARAVPGRSVRQVLGGGCSITTAGELVDEASGILGEFDPAIGAPLARYRGVMIGERGLAAIHRGRLVGAAYRSLDPVTEGEAIMTGPRGAFATRRPDGSSEVFPSACE